MVGIVLVSHSETLARGLAEMLAELAGGAVPVAVAGGTGDGGRGTGDGAYRTSAERMARTWATLRSPR